jgi:diguanylate cyclase (GGDEF)-like protein
LLDIDHFKIINDTYGHPLGDEALKKISSLLRACVRQGDVISRYGGEEFAILLPGTDKEGATITAEKIRGVMENDLKINVGARKTRNITLTAGVASYPEDGDTVEKIIAAADKYLYIGKEAGRNRVINKSVDTKVSVADAEEKRIARRSRLALKAIMNINQPRFFEIKIHDREWKMCNVKDISKSGLFGETEYEIKNGEIYTCRAVSSKEVCSRDTFMVKVAHTIRATDGRYRFGASILEENKVWLRLVSLLTY